MSTTSALPRITHCAEGRCQHEIYKSSCSFICREFLKLIRSGHNPTDCPWYDSTKDIENFKRGGKS